MNNRLKKYTLSSPSDCTSNRSAPVKKLDHGMGLLAHMHEAVLDYWPLHVMCIEIDPCHTIARNVASIVTSPEALFLIGDLQLGVSAHGDNLVMILDLGS